MFIEPYTVREARIHVRHVRDLLKSVDLDDAYNGIDCNSLSFLNVVTGGDVLGEYQKMKNECVFFLFFRLFVISKTLVCCM